MTYRARLVLVRLVMKRRRARRCEIHRRRVALKAKAVHVAAYEQARIRRSVWKMARGAALSLDRRMFVNERPEGIDVALGANGVLCRTDPNEIRLEGAVRVVAIGALGLDLVVSHLQARCILDAALDAGDGLGDGRHLRVEIGLVLPDLLR